MTNPANTLYATKRLIGRKFAEPEVKGVAKLVPYKICKADTSDDAWFETTTGTKFSPRGAAFSRNQSFPGTEATPPDRR